MSFCCYFLCFCFYCYLFSISKLSFQWRRNEWKSKLWLWQCTGWDVIHKLTKFGPNTTRPLCLRWSYTCEKNRHLHLLMYIGFTSGMHVIKIFNRTVCIQKYHDYIVTYNKSQEFVHKKYGKCQQCEYNNKQEGNFSRPSHHETFKNPLKVKRRKLLL